MRKVTIKHDGVKIRVVEMFSGPGSGYERVPEYVPRTMPTIHFEITLEDGTLLKCSDWKLGGRENLRLTDDEASTLVEAARLEAKERASKRKRLTNESEPK